MNIEQFVAQSEEKWRSMRSGHSLAFQQFEDVLSEVEITRIKTTDTDIAQLLAASDLEADRQISSPFRMSWSAESDWEPDDPSEVSSGSCLIVPLPLDKTNGKLLRSVGYAVRENTVIALLAAHCRGLDEELDRSELAAVLRELDARALFARFDADGSGTIDGDELARALASVGRAEFGPAAVKVSAHAACRRRASPGPRES